MLDQQLVKNHSTTDFHAEQADSKHPSHVLVPSRRPQKTAPCHGKTGTVIVRRSFPPHTPSFISNHTKQSCLLTLAPHALLSVLLGVFTIYGTFYLDYNFSALAGMGSDGNNLLLLHLEGCELQRV